MMIQCISFVFLISTAPKQTPLHLQQIKRTHKRNSLKSLQLAQNPSHFKRLLSSKSAPYNLKAARNGSRKRLSFEAVFLCAHFLEGEACCCCEGRLAFLTGTAAVGTWERYLRRRREGVGSSFAGSEGAVLVRSCCCCWLFLAVDLDDERE